MNASSILLLLAFLVSASSVLLLLAFPVSSRAPLPDQRVRTLASICRPILTAKAMTRLLSRSVPQSHKEWTAADYPGHTAEEASQWPS